MGGTHETFSFSPPSTNAAETLCGGAGLLSTVTSIVPEVEIELSVEITARYPTVK